MKKSLKIVLVFAIAFSLFSTVVFAKSYIKDLFQADEKLKVKDDLDGTAFLAGNTVNIESAIKGIGFVAGNIVNFDGNSEYLFLAGNEVNITGVVKNDSFIAGSIINIKKDAELERDVYIAGGEINIEGNIDRNIYLMGEEVTLNGTFNGNVVVNSTNINVTDAKILGTLKYNDDASIKGVSKDIKTKKYENKNNNTYTFKDYIASLINSYIHIAIVAVILIALFEKLFKKTVKKEIDSKSVLSTFGKGLLVLIGGPIIAFMLMLTGLFVSVGVIAGLIYGIIVYISTIFGVYYIANYIDKKYLNKNLNGYMLVVFGLLALYLLRLIPFVGGVLYFLVMVFGIGVIWNTLNEIRK